MNTLRGKSNRHLLQKTMSRKIHWATFKIFTDVLNVHVIKFFLDPVNFFNITEFKCVCMLSHFSRVQLFASLGAVALQAPLSTGFSRQEYWNGLPCSPPGELPNPMIKLMSLTVSYIGRWVLYH